MRIARRAGSMAAISATTPENATPATASHAGIMLLTCMFSNSTGNSFCAAQLRPRPNMPPNMPSISASIKNMPEMLPSEVPMTFSMPISFVRSVMDIIIVFATHIALTSIATAPIAPSMPCIWRD